MAVFSEIVVRHNTRLLKTRTLPSPGKVLVKTGDTVGPTAIIAKTDYLRESPRVVDLRAEFKTPIPPDLVESVVLKKPGDSVKAGELIASLPDDRSGRREVVSPCNGTIQYISRLDARILIREDVDSMEPMCVVPVSSILKSNPKWLRAHVTVREGQYVKEGQIIAGYMEPGNFSAVYAPISGFIARICPRTGNVAIVRPMETLKVTAHVPGRIAKVLPNYGAAIESYGCYLEGVFGVGGECHGQLWVMTQDPGDVLETEGIGPEVDGKIIVAGAGVTYEAMQKALHLGAKGIIAGGLNQKDVVRLTGRELGFTYSVQPEPHRRKRRGSAQGSSEAQGTATAPNPGFTMIMMEGAGVMPMNHRAWEALGQSHGAIASIDGTTRLSGELLRPWIFIGRVPDDTIPGHEISETGIESRRAAPVCREKVEPGDRVRCVRPPYLGLWGVVEQMMPGRIPLESEGLMEAVRIRLDDGSLVDVAEANIEVVSASRAES